MILTDDEIRKAAEFAAEQMWPESGYVGWTEDDAVFHRKFTDALLDKLLKGVEVPEPQELSSPHDERAVYGHSRDQLLACGAAQRLAGREQVLKKATALDWTAIMREGSLVTWGDAETLGCRVVEHIRALAASPQEQQP